MKNREAIDIDATTYSEKQKTKTKKQKKDKKMLQHLKTKFFMLQLNSARIPKYEHRIESFIIYLCLIYKYMRQVYMTRM